MGIRFFSPLVAFFATVALLGTISARAADLPPGPGPTVMAPQPVVTEGGWEIFLASYAWAAGLKGDIAQFGAPTVPVDASFFDILKNLDFAFFVAGQARYGRWGIFTDFIYSDVSTGKATPGPLFGSVKVSSQMLLAKATGFYRIAENGKSHLDVLGGLHVVSIDSKLAFTAGINPAITFKDSDTWVDPIVGIKGRLDLNSNYYLNGWAMIGGFGVSSDLVWDVFGGIGYDVNNWFSAVAGYRGLGIDYQNGNFVFDVVQHGPILGGVFRF